MFQGRAGPATQISKSERRERQHGHHRRPRSDSTVRLKPRLSKRQRQKQLVLSPPQMATKVTTVVPRMARIAGAEGWSRMRLSDIKA